MLHDADDIGRRLGPAAMLVGSDNPEYIDHALAEVAGPEGGHDPEKADTTMRYLAISTDRIVAVNDRLRQAGGLGRMLCGQCRLLVAATARNEARPNPYDSAAVAVAHRNAIEAAAQVLAMEGGR
jgi:hypothetical protein